MYSGFVRDYNPGCFLILHVTLQELRARIPDAVFDIYARDIRGSYHGVRRDVLHGVVINHFTSVSQIELLDDVLTTYDAIVIGGDVVWGFGGASCDIFFLQSRRFRARSKPVVIFNCVHTFLTRSRVCGSAPEADELRWLRLVPPDRMGAEHQRRFVEACSRATYVSVRTPYVKAMLDDIGVSGARCVADPAFLLNRDDLDRWRVRMPQMSGRRVITVAAHWSKIDSFLDAIAEREMDRDIVIYPYSMQYGHLELVIAARRRFGDRFGYLDRYYEPLETASIIGQGAASINDTYHGMVLAILAGIPFVTFNNEPKHSSRFYNLLQPLELSGRCVDWSVAEELDHRARVRVWHDAFDRLETAYQPVTARVQELQKELSHHFDDIAALIVDA
jgi:polysaccharide pyruvyl transferase WcaK-like protein